MAWPHPAAFYPLGILPPLGALYTAAPSSGARPHGLAASPWIGGILQPLSSLTRPASCRPRWMSATLPMRPPPLPYRTHHISFIRFICHICHIRFIRHIRLIHHINNIHTKWWRPPPSPCGSALRPRGTHALPSGVPLHMHHPLRPRCRHALPSGVLCTCTIPCAPAAGTPFRPECPCTCTIPCAPAARTPFRPECSAHAPSPAPLRHARPSVRSAPAHAPSPRALAARTACTRA